MVGVLNFIYFLPEALGSVPMSIGSEFGNEASSASKEKTEAAYTIPANRSKNGSEIARAFGNLKIEKLTFLFCEFFPSRFI